MPWPSAAVALPGLYKQDYDGAIADLSEAIRIDPKKSELFERRGYARLM